MLHHAVRIPRSVAPWLAFIPALKAIDMTIIGLGKAMLTSPLGVITAALALDAYLLIRHWEQVKAFFGGFIRGMVDGLMARSGSWATAARRGRWSAGQYSHATRHPRPIYRLVVNGQDITPKLEKRLISLALADNRGMEADQLSVTHGRP